LAVSGRPDRNSRCRAKVCFFRRQRLLRVVHAHLLAGAEWRLHDPQRPLTHDRLLYVIQRPFGRITSMPATGRGCVKTRWQSIFGGIKTPRRRNKTRTARSTRSSLPTLHFARSFYTASARSGHRASAPRAVFHLNADDRSSVCATTSPRTNRLRRRGTAVAPFGSALDPGRVHRG
jgi:hypothetical protein